MYCLSSPIPGGNLVEVALVVVEPEVTDEFLDLAE